MIWEEPFGLKYLTFGNAYFSATIVPAAATLTAFSIGREIRFGKDLDSSDVLVAKWYV
eukprot:m.218474 g.218474  ORF g.218474 m.218474 type:complete len:58 (+) comp39898_c0_seq20:1003-1176(+)